jgi:DMSO/TMAO reductase YedYZ molybdopterin-dependent catalytic subunit
MASKKPPRIWDRTVERRTVLQWLGTGSVMALGGRLLSACMSAEEGAGGGAGGDGGGVDGSPANICETGGVPQDFPFEPGPLTRPLFTPWYERTVDPQDLTRILSDWRLTVDGLVESPKVFTFSDVLCLERQDQVTDFHCVEGWSVYDVPWNGVHLSRILEEVRPTTSASHLTLHSFGGVYVESLPLSVALEPRSMLAYGVNDNTIPQRHGFPLRMVVPRLLGYKNAKFVQRLELASGPVNGFWVSRGYPYDGEVPESRLRDGKY